MSVRDTNKLNHKYLKYLLIDNLNLYTEDAFYVEGNNPYTFSINKKIVYIYIKNVHQSGQNRSNEDECRIQVSSSQNFIQAQSSGKIVFMLGYFDDENVFTAWNPRVFRDRINARQTVSLYSRFSIQKDANKNGISVYKDNNNNTAISFKPEYIGLYLENYDNMHMLNQVELKELVEKYHNLDSPESEEEQIKIRELNYTVTHTHAPRDPNFKRIVDEIYGHRCAVCGVQLELVEAAHIIPHSHEKGSDDPTNGICMCALHHTAYDKGLIYIDESYKIKVNDDKVSYLEKIKRDGGMSKFLKLHNEELDLPSSNRPSVEFLKVANAIRGIGE